MLLRHVYSVLFSVLLPFAVARLLWRSWAEPLYRETMGERFGYVPEGEGERPVWVHAVSAGETNAAAPLVERLIELGYPVIITTMTPTGRGRVRALFGDRVRHTYAPYDIPGMVRRFFDRIDPRLLIVVDTELWPNILSEANRRGVESVFVNARLSERSARSYSRVRPLTREMLANVSCIACQTPAQGERFIALGLPPDKLVVAGSIKFDVARAGGESEQAEAIRRKLEGRRVILGASTHAGEESVMLDVLVAINDPCALMVVAPRHPNRIDEVASLCRQRGLAIVRHSTGEPVGEDTRVLLVDTMGELLYFYDVAELAFVGGSLVPVGGHNPMEPASVGTPFVMGPHLFNIDEIADRFADAGAMRVAQTKVELVELMKTLYDDAAMRRTMVDRANRVMAENRGALDRVSKIISDKLREKSSVS